MAQNSLQIGDKVTFVNDYGVEFANKTIVGTETWPHSVNPDEVRYFYAPSDTPWFSNPARNFRKENN